MAVKDIIYYKKCFLHLKRSSKRGEKAPHKLILLLAVFERVKGLLAMGAAGQRMIGRNLIDLNPKLEQYFYAYWHEYVDSDLFLPAFATPFFHMENEPFWTLTLKKDKAPASSQTEKKLYELYEGAYIDAELMALLINDTSREELRTFVLDLLSNRTEYFENEGILDYSDKPPSNPFLSESGAKKQTVIEKLKAFLNKFLNTSERDDSAIHPSSEPVEKKTGKKKTQILRVEFQDGRIIEDRNVSTTYCAFIKEVGAEEVSILDISHAGVNIVSKELDSKYADYQRSIGDGWYVMTNSPTTVKYHDLQRIIEEYQINVKDSLVSLDTSESAQISTPTPKSGVREKIRILFPDGRVIQPSKVLEALIEVVKYAGPERVRSLNIICCGDNLILKNPSQRYLNPSKPVGDGWLCNTCSDTRTKYEQIRLISEQLGLGLEVEIVKPT